MKTGIILSMLFGTMLFNVTLSKGQCNTDEYISNTVASLSAGYNFLKSYKIDGEPDLEKIEFSYVLTKGTQYMLMLKDKNSQPGTVITLFDSKRNKVASSKIGGSVVSAIAFPCNATGIYYIQYTFEPGSVRCAGSTLAFKR